MKPKSSLSHSQQSTNGSYPVPCKSIPNPHNVFNIYFYITLSSTKKSLPRSALFPSSFLNKILYTFLNPIYATCPAHPILLVHSF